MADLILPEDFFDDWLGESDENPLLESKIIVEETDSHDVLSSENLDEPSKDCSNMTLKQESEDSELFATEELLNPDDLLPPVVKLEKYAHSEISFNRQVVCRNLLETLCLVHANKEEVGRVAAVLCTVSEDYDPSVRSELMMHIADLTAFCKEVKLNDFIVQHIVPILVSYVGDENNLVRKFTHSCILSCVEQELLDRVVVSEKICPLMLHFIESMHSEELRIESLSIIIKLISYAGKQTAEELFLEPFLTLCSDKSNNIRKACAGMFGELATTVGREITEQLLLKVFFLMCCEDAAWGVRKACAENFMAISCVVSKETRHKELASVYMILLSDQSRWVRLTAYQALGPFISTFAEPDRTGLYYSKEGVLTVVDSPVSPKNSSPESSASIDGEAAEPSDSSASSLERTNNSSNACDSVVPDNSVADTQDSVTTEESCHEGNNYCTVIEVGSPTQTNGSGDADATTTTNSDSVDCDPTTATQIQHEDVNWTSEKVCENGPCSNSTSDSGDRSPNCKKDGLEEDEFNKIWWEAFYNNKDTLNGALELEFANCIQNLKKSPLLSSITVNGLNISLSSPVNGGTIPVITCSNSKKVFKLKNCIKFSDDRTDGWGDDVSMSQEHECESTKETSECWGHCCIPSFDSDSAADRTLVQTVQGDDESAFNHFQYWREPLPDLDAMNVVDILIQDDRPSQITSRSWCQEEPRKFSLSSSFDRSYLRSASDQNPEKGEPPPGAKVSVHDQDIVPPELLLQYLSMIDAAWAQTIDAEIARHCAYSLPAVALTLGREFWPCLKETFDALTSDLQGFIMMWKVRRTVASAMHQLAVILGPDITSTDLVPVYSRFINDLDEVRIGILQHLHEFIKVLRPKERNQFLPSFPEFLISNSDTDSNEKNWRFRLILAEQLVLTAELYEPRQVRDHLVPLAFTLIKDKVCEVRLAAVRVMAAVMKRLSQGPHVVHTKFVLSELTEKFVHSPKWLYRQIFVYVCQQLIVESSLPADQFAEDALPQLLYLCWDRVPNVRIAIARCLVVFIWPMEVFSGASSPHRELLLQTIHTLQSDRDADVRFYANMVSTHECSCLQNGEFDAPPPAITHGGVDITVEPFV